MVSSQQSNFMCRDFNLICQTSGKACKRQEWSFWLLQWCNMLLACLFMSKSCFIEILVHREKARWPQGNWQWVWPHKQPTLTLDKLVACSTSPAPLSMLSFSQPSSIKFLKGKTHLTYSFRYDLWANKTLNCRSEAPKGGDEALHYLLLLGGEECERERFALHKQTSGWGDGTNMRCKRRAITMFLCTLETKFLFLTSSGKRSREFFSALCGFSTVLRARTREEREGRRRGEPDRILKINCNETTIDCAYYIHYTLIDRCECRIKSHLRQWVGWAKPRINIINHSPH